MGEKADAKYISSAELRQKTIFGRPSRFADENPDKVEFFGDGLIDVILFRKGKAKLTRSQYEVLRKNQWKLKSRLSRKAFWIHVSSFGFISTPLFLLLIWWANDSFLRTAPSERYGWNDAEIQGSIYFIGLTLIQAIQRLHDVNRKGWWLLAPGFNVYLLSRPSGPPNQYGDGPYR